MAMPVQIAVFLASIAVVVFVVGMLVAVVQIRRSVEQTRSSLDDIKGDVKLLVQDTRKLVQNLNALTESAQRQCDDVEHVVGTVRGWSDRVNRIVDEFGSALEPPMLTLARSIGVFRTGLTAFLQAVGNRKSNHEQKDEESHG